MALPISRSENADAAVGQHFFEDGRHLSEVARVFGVDASAGSLCAVGEAEQQVTDALEADHELHTGEKFASLGGADFGDRGGDAAVDFHIERVEFALALAQGIEQDGGASGDAFGGGSGGLFGHATGVHGAAHDVLVSWFGIWSLDRGAHNYVRLARPRAAARSFGAVVALLPFVGWDGQRLSIRFHVDSWLISCEFSVISCSQPSYVTT